MFEPIESGIAINAAERTESDCAHGLSLERGQDIPRGGVFRFEGHAAFHLIDPITMDPIISHPDSDRLKYENCRYNETHQEQRAPRPEYSDGVFIPTVISYGNRLLGKQYLKTRNRFTACLA